MHFKLPPCRRTHLTRRVQREMLFAHRWPLARANGAQRVLAFGSIDQVFDDWHGRKKTALRRLIRGLIVGYWVAIGRLALSVNTLIRIYLVSVVSATQVLTVQQSARGDHLHCAPSRHRISVQEGYRLRIDDRIRQDKH